MEWKSIVINASSGESRDQISTDRAFAEVHAPGQVCVGIAELPLQAPHNTHQVTIWLNSGRGKKHSEIGRLKAVSKASQLRSPWKGFVDQIQKGLVREPSELQHAVGDHLRCTLHHP
ncbi:hypothetical protein N7G274_006581 [Stereocaulon virgatum]|uniref:Uncharacterized protein n=1 Tax=Stereocaulon virgatum TaxID=373712 RepID=A0ABR4A3W0_9LECA